MALKGIEEEIDDSEDENEDADKDEDLTFIGNEIIKLLQYRKKDKNKTPRKSESSRKSKNEKPFIQCHERFWLYENRVPKPSYEGKIQEFKR